MGDDVLAAYVFCHYNWQFEFLRPSIADIVKEYIINIKVHSDISLRSKRTRRTARPMARQTTKPTMSMESKL